jgi:hypothetical protein
MTQRLTLLEIKIPQSRVCAKAIFLSGVHICSTSLTQNNNDIDFILKNIEISLNLKSFIISKTQDSDPENCIESVMNGIHLIGNDYIEYCETELSEANVIPSCMHVLDVEFSTDEMEFIISKESMSKLREAQKDDYGS